MPKNRLRREEEGRPTSRGLHLHAHGAADPALLAAERGVAAVKVSFLALLATALVQVAIVLLSGSVALLADTVHNLGDAATAVPLYLAFSNTDPYTHSNNRANHFSASFCRSIFGCCS